MSSRPYIIALTGGIGSGKSTVADLFKQCGAFIVDTDVIAHAVTDRGGRALPAICKAFGESILDRHGALDRPKMRSRVFADARARAALEEIIHPIIRAEVDAAMASATAFKAPYAILAVPLLFETMGYRGRIQRTLAVDCPIDLQRKRVQARSGLSIAEIDRILNVQLDRSLRLQLADDVISNSGEMASLTVQVAQKHAIYQMLLSAWR